MNQRPSNLSEEIAAESTLLDFYSDRAVAQASFLLAAMFGLVTLLAIVQEMIRQTLMVPSQRLSWLIYVSLFPFWVLAYLGYHTLRRFGSYATAASDLEIPLRDRSFAPEHFKKRVKKNAQRIKKSTGH